MKFKGSDTCIEDYRRRRDALIKYLETKEPNVNKRARLILQWLDENSPYEPHEQALNFKRALFGDERH